MFNDILFTNVTVYNSQTRVRPILGPFLSLASSANFTMTGCSINLFGSTSEDYPPILFTTITGCNPSDGLLQTFSIENSKFALTQIGDYSRYTQIRSNIDSSYLRKVVMSLNSLSFTGLNMTTKPLIKLYANQKSRFVSSGITLTNSSFSDSIIFVSSVKQVLLTGYSFSNITKFGKSMVQLVD